MPIYDFKCNKCAVEFEELVFSGDRVACPGCGSADVARQLSAFAIGRGGDRSCPSAENCSSAGSGRCPAGGCCKF